MSVQSVFDALSENPPLKYPDIPRQSVVCKLLTSKDRYEKNDLIINRMMFDVGGHSAKTSPVNPLVLIHHTLSM